LSAEKLKARQHWEHCRRESAERAAAGGPTLEQMISSYEFKQIEASCLDGNDLSPFSEQEDALLDGIIEETAARMSCHEYEQQSLSRVFGNSTSRVYQSIGIPVSADR